MDWRSCVSVLGDDVRKMADSKILLSTGEPWGQGSPLQEESVRNTHIVACSQVIGSDGFAAAESAAAGWTRRHDS